jgi:high-affinity Fe2+/Pb2+ permease
VGGLLVAVLLGYLFKQWLKKKGLQ